MKVDELRTEKIIKDWLSGIKAASSTKQSYIASMQQYTEFTNKTPLELIEEAEKEIKAGLLMRERNITSYLREFREDLENKELAPLTVKNRMTSVCSFYRSYNIQLPIIPKSTQKAKPELKRKKIPDKEDIRHMLKFCDPLERAILLVGVSSGLSVTDISNLKVSDFTEGYDEKTGIITLHLIRKKMNYEFFTFLSPECSKAVLDYIAWRNRTTKNDNSVRGKRLIKKHVNNETGYLFVSRYVSDNYLTTKKEKEKEESRKLAEKSIIAIYQRLNEEANKSSPLGEYNLIRTHNMRRFFNSSLLAAKASIFFVDFLLGHQLDATHEAYFRADPKSLREEYQKYLPYITIEKALDISNSPEFIQAKTESDKFAKLAATAAVERDELQELRAEIQKIKDTESIRREYMQIADLDQIRQLKAELQKELEEVSKMKDAIKGGE
jgi:integrase